VRRRGRRGRGRRRRQPGLHRAPCGDERHAYASRRFPDAGQRHLHGPAQGRPSQIVDGYYEGDITEAFGSYKGALEDADGYDVTKDEKEEDDAEVNFEGGGSSGQVKLLQSCEDRTSVTITARPE
jgi:hypothetical protein